DQSATEGAAGSFTLGTFADVGLLDWPWSIEVDWGDNSADTLFAAASQGPLGTRGHVFASPGDYSVTVKVTDKDGGAVSRVFGVNVIDAPLHASGRPLSAVAGQPFSGAVASFTDDNPAGSIGEYTATIHWGDGQTTTIAATTGGIVSDGNGGYL